MVIHSAAREPGWDTITSLTLVIDDCQNYSLTVVSQMKATNPPPSQPGSVLVTSVLIAIALLDLATGAYLLLSPAPWAAHGPGTPWIGAPDVLVASAGSEALVMSLFRRLGAFSVQAALATLLVAWLGHRDLRIQGAALGTWTAAGLAFAWTDNTWFAGTTYLLGKQLIGVLWVVAIAAFAIRWSRGPSAE